MTICARSLLACLASAGAHAFCRAFPNPGTTVNLGYIHSHCFPARVPIEQAIEAEPDEPAHYVRLMHALFNDDNFHADIHGKELAAVEQKYEALRASVLQMYAERPQPGPEDSDGDEEIAADQGSAKAESKATNAALRYEQRLAKMVDRYTLRARTSDVEREPDSKEARMLRYAKVQLQFAERKTIKSQASVEEPAEETQHSKWQVVRAANEARGKGQMTKLDVHLHRSRQTVPFARREHLHDGLRMMIADIPREFGWLIQRSTTKVLMNEADELESALYLAHERAHAAGLALKQIKAQVIKEYEAQAAGRGLSFDQYIDTSASFGVVMYRDRVESMMLKITDLRNIVADCVARDAKLKEEIAELQTEFADSAMHCRRLTAEELAGLDVRVSQELQGGDQSNVVVPFRSAEELSQARWSPNFEGDGRLETYVNTGGFAFVGISCDVAAVQIAGALTLVHNPCLPPRLGPGTLRLGRCLRILFLADNNLGAFHLRSILKGMKESKDIEIFHCHSNSIGELGEGSAQVSPDADPSDSLTAMEEMAQIFSSKTCPLRVVGLSRNNLGAAGLFRLMRGVEMNSSITVLDLSENSIGVSGANWIAKALAHNRSLQTLNINKTMCTHYGLKAICSALQFNPTLRILFALQNVGPAARQDLFKMMSENTTLELMHLYPDTPWLNPHYLGSESAKEIAKFDDIPGGVPFTNKFNLIRTFKTFNALVHLDQQALASVDGVKLSTASVIFEYFHPPQTRNSSGSIRGSNPGSRQGVREGSLSQTFGSEPTSPHPAVKVLEAKGYFHVDDYVEDIDPWNITGCLDDGPRCVWEPVPSECFRLNFLKKRPLTSETETSSQIPSPDRYTPDRLSTAGSHRLTTAGSRPDTQTSDDNFMSTAGTRDEFGRAGSSHQGARLGTAITGTTDVKSGKSSGASQVEERLRANEEKRKSGKGVSVIWANQALKPIDTSRKPVPQSFGQPRQVGVNAISSQQIRGLVRGVKGVTVYDKKNLRCAFCASQVLKAGVGEYGHEDYECPLNFYQQYGECLPGFNERGYKIEEMWEAGAVEPKPELEKQWKKLIDKGYFQEPTEGVPILQRQKPMFDRTKRGQTRKRWDERSAFGSKDAAIRKELFESTKRSGEALFTFGEDKFNEFLRERSGLSDSERPALQSRDRRLTADYHLPDATEISLEMREKLGLYDGGGDFHTRKDVHMSEHDGVSFIPSAHKRREIFMQKIRNNRFEDAKDFVSGKYGVISVDAKDARTGATALMEAAQTGSKRILRLLIKSNASVNTQDRKGNTALHYASAYHYQAIVDYLMAHGADESIINVKGKTYLEGI